MFQTSRFTRGGSIARQAHAFGAAEVFGVIGDEGEAVREGSRRDPNIVIPNVLAFAFEFAGEARGVP